MKYVIVLFFLFCSGLLNAQDYWQQLQGPEGGDLGSLYSSQDGTLYLISGFSGSYRSTDNGLHWMRLNVPYPNTDYRGYLATNSKGEIYIATFNQGLLRSTDYGQNWVLINTVDSINHDINGIFIDKNDRIYLFGNYGNVSVSSDNGNVFRPFIDKKTIDENIIGFYTNSDSLFYIAMQSKIFISKNGGKTWNTFKFGQWLDFMQVNSFSEPFVSFNKDLYVSRDRGTTWDTVYVKWNWNSYRNIAFGKDSDLYLSTDTDSIFMTSDYGKTWKYISTNGLNEGGKIFTDRNFELFHSAHYNGLYKFNVQSNSWIESNTGLYCQKIDGIETNASGHIFAITPNGLYKSLDEGKSWKLIMVNENPDYTTQAVHVVKTNNNLYLANLKGLFKSADEGETWEKTSICDNCGITAIASNNIGTLYAGSRYLYSSADNGLNWTKIESYPYYVVSYIFINDNGWIYAGAEGGLYLSKDDGINWKNLNAPTGFEMIINKVYADKNKDVFLLMSNLPLLRSQDEGASWPWLNVNLWGGSVDFRVLPNGDYMVSGTDGVYISKDQGDTWVLNSSGLKDWRSTFFTLDNEGTIYLGTYSTSIYKSSQKITRLNKLNEEKNQIQVNYNNGQIQLTTISNHHQDFDLSILNLDGKLIKTFSHQQLQSGKNEIELQLNGLTSGIYFYQMYLKSQVYSGKFTVIE